MLRCSMDTALELREFEITIVLLLVFDTRRRNLESGNTRGICEEPLVARDVDVPCCCSDCTRAPIDSLCDCSAKPDAVAGV